jgi:membrane protease subunit HflK
MDTVENVLGRAHKVLIDSRAGGNLLYLPIDKLLEKSNGRDNEPANESAGAGSAKEQDSVTVEARGRGER